MKPEYIPTLSFLGTLAVLLVGFLYNNSRLSDLRTHVDTRISDINTRISDLRSELLAGLRRLEEVMDTRLTKIEEHLKLN